MVKKIGPENSDGISNQAPFSRYEPQHFGASAAWIRCGEGDTR